MSQAHSHLAYAPRGPGLLYALTWFAAGDDVYGWFIGARDGGELASYFMLQDYYSTRDTVFHRSVEDDIVGPWVRVEDGREKLHSTVPPVPEPVRHELSRLQDQFVRHWLFFDDDPAAQAEAEALRSRQLPVRHVNVRSDRLDKFRTAAAVWRYDAPAADRNVPLYLSKRWPLDFTAEE